MPSEGALLWMFSKGLQVGLSDVLVVRAKAAPWVSSRSGKCKGVCAGQEIWRFFSAGVVEVVPGDSSTLYRLGDSSSIEVEAVAQIGDPFDVGELAALAGATISSTVCQLDTYIGLVRTNLDECFDRQLGVYRHTGCRL
jgi:hypothetical protein